MPKDKLTEYSATNASNTDVGGINIDEGMLPSAVNNSIRELMTHLKNFSDGTDAITGLTVDGDIKLDGNYPTGTNNVALGDAALDDGSLSGSENTAVGSNALSATTTGERNTAVGAYAADSLTTGSANTAVGDLALQTATTGGDNSAFGAFSLDALTTGSYNTGIGRGALGGTTTANNNTAVGYNALIANTTANGNTALGYQALAANTTGNGNTAVGLNAMDANTVGDRNTAVGTASLGAFNVTSNDDTLNTAVGYESLASLTTGTKNTAVGGTALGNATTAARNVGIGRDAGLAVTTGTNNTFVGDSCGNTVTTGSKNTILGRYNGNQDGLDIRTVSNRVVLSDGDGNVRQHVDDNGRVTWGNGGYSNHHGFLSLEWSAPDYVGFGMKNTSASGGAIFRFFNNTGTMVGQITTNNSVTTYDTSSDYRLKENVSDMTGAISRVKSLQPKRFNFIADTTDTLIDGFLAHEAATVVPEAVNGDHDGVDDDGNAIIQGMDYSKLVPVLTAALKEAITKIETLETKVAALEAE